MLLSSVINTDTAKRLDAVLVAKGESPVLKGLGDQNNALRFMHACLRGSYLFGRFTVPSYMSHVFDALRSNHPANAITGPLIRKLTDMCVGELATNNVYERNECHAHFWDLHEAYSFAGGNTQAFEQFMQTTQEKSVQAAIQESPAWSKGSVHFAHRLIECCDDQLSSFIMLPCNEILTTVIYPVTLKYLNDHPRNNKFRRFLEVHVQLDGDNHGQVALDWLDWHLKHHKYSGGQIEVATYKVLRLHGGPESTPLLDA